MIEPALVYVVRRGLDEAVRTDAQAIIIDMDTPGGAVQAAVKLSLSLDMWIYRSTPMSIKELTLQAHSLR